jgi:hypothetical protein
MAMTTGAGNQTLFFVDVKMSSQFPTKKSETYEDENAKKLWYKYSKDDRDAINAVRRFVGRHVDMCPRFMKRLTLANEESKAQLIEVVIEADRRMKAIDPALSAGIEFEEITGSQLNSGTMLQKITTAINDQIIQKALNEIEAKIEKNANSGMLNKRQKDALVKAINSYRGINILNDAEINTKIDGMIKQIEGDMVVTLKDELTASLDATKGRFARIDMEMGKTTQTEVIEMETPSSDAQTAPGNDDGITVSTGTGTVIEPHDIDDSEFDAKPLSGETDGKSRYNHMEI